MGPQSGSDLPSTIHSTPPRTVPHVPLPTFHSCAEFGHLPSEIRGYLGRTVVCGPHWCCILAVLSPRGSSVSKRRHCTFLPHFPELGRVPGACCTCHTNPSIFKAFLACARVCSLEEYTLADFFREMTSEGFSITVFIVGGSFGRVFSFRSGFQLLPGVCPRIPVSLRSLFEEVHTFPT